MFPFPWLGKPVFLVQQEDRDSGYLKLHREEALDQVLHFLRLINPSAPALQWPNSKVSGSSIVFRTSRVRVSLAGGFCPLEILKCICSTKRTLHDIASFPFSESYGDER